MDTAQRSWLIDTLRQPIAPGFRGQIYDYAAKLDLQAGYAVHGNFDITTLQHLVEPLQAIRDPKVRVVSIQGAVQTTKSLIADIVVPYWIEHDPGDTLWLFEDDPKAKRYAETRCMPLIRSVPEIARLLKDVDRHDNTKMFIKFAHMNLVMAGLNLGNVQSISYRYVIIDEAWMSRATGLIRQAMDRTKQYPDTKKIILIGQGGWEDEDFDRMHKETDQRVLQYRCPFCNEPQQYELAKLRGDDFPVQALRGTYAGLSWDTNEKTKINGRWNYEEVWKTAHHRCYFCDGRIDDTPEMRRKLNDSHHYRVTNPGAPSSMVGFQWPGEASMRVEFGELATKYLRAKVAKEELAYDLPMQEFYQKDRGLVWRDDIEDRRGLIRSEAYDVNAAWPEERYRVLIADCQRDLQKFYYQVWAISLAGEARELARGTAASFDELAATQAAWKIKDQRVFLDCGYEMTKVLRECVKRGHWGWIKHAKDKSKRYWLCWTGLKGSGQEMWRYENPKRKWKEWRIYSERKFYDVNVGTNSRHPRAPWYEWSNLHCKDLLRARRDQEAGVPKFLTLPEEAAPDDIWSYFAQMRSEKRIEKYSNGKKRAIWEPVKETRPNHFWDIGAMLMAFMAIAGIIGAPAEDGGDNPESSG